MKIDEPLNIDFVNEEQKSYGDVACVFFDNGKVKIAVPNGKEKLFAFLPSALEKQVPKKPLVDEAIRRGCPVCCTELGNDDGYCPNCGQAIKEEE